MLLFPHSIARFFIPLPYFFLNFPLSTDKNRFFSDRNPVPRTYIFVKLSKNFRSTDIRNINFQGLNKFYFPLVKLTIQPSIRFTIVKETREFYLRVIIKFPVINLPAKS